MAAKNSTPPTTISTDRQVNALRPQPVAYMARDTGSIGLYLRVNPNGKFTWIARYRDPLNTRQVKLTIGHYIRKRPTEPLQGMGLGEARTEWQRLKGHLGKGTDPREVLAEERDSKARAAEELASADTAGKNTVAELVKAWSEATSSYKKSWRKDKARLENHLLPTCGNVPVYELTRSQIREALEPLRSGGKNIQANRVLAAIRAAYNWGMAEDWPSQDNPIAHNPCAGLKMTAEKPRQRVLNEKELTVLVRELPNHADAEHADFILFLLATGCRIGEVCSMEWSQVSGREWLLPETKNGRQHLVYLSDYARAILDRRTTEKGYVWPNENTSTGHIRFEAINIAIQAALPGLKLKPFTPHDLRRTLGTWLGHNEVDERVHDRILNHVTGGIRVVYNTARYDRPAKEQWQHWGSYLQGLATDNVVNIEEKRA